MTTQYARCKHCGEPIRSGHQSYNWLHRDTGKADCDRPPVLLKASPRVGFPREALTGRVNVPGETGSDQR